MDHKNLILSHSAQRKDPYYSLAKGVVLKADLKILKVKYLSNLLLDHTQISSLYDQTIFCQFFKGRQPPMEEDLKIFKVEYHSIQQPLIGSNSNFQLKLV